MSEREQCTECGYFRYVALGDSFNGDCSACCVWAEQQMCALRAERDALVNILADVFGWSDRSYGHAVMHADNGVKNLRAEVAALKVELAKFTEPLAQPECSEECTKGDPER